MALTRLAAGRPGCSSADSPKSPTLLKPRSVYRDPELVARVLSVMGEA